MAPGCRGQARLSWMPRTSKRSVSVAMRSAARRDGDGQFAQPALRHLQALAPAAEVVLGPVDLQRGQVHGRHRIVTERQTGHAEIAGQERLAATGAALDLAAGRRVVHTIHQPAQGQADRALRHTTVSRPVDCDALSTRTLAGCAVRNGPAVLPSSSSNKGLVVLITVAMARSAVGGPSSITSRRQAPGFVRGWPVPAPA